MSPEKTEVDKNLLHDELTEAFIGYQYRLDNPMPSPGETRQVMIIKFRSDPIFNAKVRSLVSGIMRIVDKHLI